MKSAASSMVRDSARSTACLIPFDVREAIAVATAAKIAGVSPRTIRSWCEIHHIGRRVGGGLRVSKVALTMFLEADQISLAAYLAGDRKNERVRRYFERFRLAG